MQSHNQKTEGCPPDEMAQIAGDVSSKLLILLASFRAGLNNSTVQECDSALRTLSECQAQLRSHMIKRFGSALGGQSPELISFYPATTRSLCSLVNVALEWLCVAVASPQHSHKPSSVGGVPGSSVRLEKPDPETAECIEDLRAVRNAVYTLWAIIHKRQDALVHGIVNPPKRA